MALVDSAVFVFMLFYLKIQIYLQFMKRLKRKGNHFVLDTLRTRTDDDYYNSSIKSRIKRKQSSNSVNGNVAETSYTS